MCIAGYTHSGLEKSGRPWVLAGAALVAASAVLRACAYALDATALLMGAAALLWCAAFALMSWRMLPVFWRPRADGQGGCDGVLDAPQEAASAPADSAPASP